MRAARLVLSILLAGCGATAPRDTTTSNELGDDVVCAPESAPLRYRFSGLPDGVVAQRLDGRTCMIAPVGAEAPFPWVVLVGTEHLEDPSDPQPVMHTSAPVLARGELDLIGLRAPYLLYAQGSPLVGDGETLATQLPLTRHLLGSTIATSDRAPADLREQAIAWLARMTIEATDERADALPYDPSLVRCGAGDVPLLVPVLDGAHLDRQSTENCLVLTGDEPTASEWVLDVVSWPIDDAAMRTLASEPDGARRFFEESTPGATFVEDGAIEWLGAPTRWYAFDVMLPDGTPRFAAITRVVDGERVIIATIITQPAMRGRLPELLDALHRTERLDQGRGRR